MPVIALVERNGKMRAKVVERVGSKELKGVIRQHVDKQSTIMTDDWPSYRGIGKDYGGGHHIVKHGYKEYARGMVHVKQW